MYSRDLGWLRLAILLPVLSLVLLSQCYWFVHAWRLARKIGRPLPRLLLRGACLSAFVLIDLVLALNVGFGPSQIVWRNSTVTSLSGLWLSSALLAYLAVQFVTAVAWMLRAVRRIVALIWRSASPAAKAEAEPAAQREPAAENDPAHPPVDLARRRFVQTATALAGAIPFAGAAYGFAFERLNYQVRRVDLPVSGLPPALRGLRIAQLSDIHIGSYMSAADVRRAVGMANDLGADLAVVTGDFLTGVHDPLEACIAELSRLRAPLGVWGCNGNHEVYAGVEALAATLFERYGMRLLRQQNAELLWRGQAFNLIGVDYQRERRRRPMLAAIAPMVRRDVPNILLSHNPNSFPRAAELGIEAMLAGHTHGGQVKFEILDHRFSPARFLTPYVAGMYQRPLGAAAALTDDELRAGAPATQSAVVYVNRGLGTIGAPVRLGVPPEITLHTLCPA